MKQGQDHRQNWKCIPKYYSSNSDKRKDRTDRQSIVKQRNQTENEDNVQIKERKGKQPLDTCMYGNQNKNGKKPYIEDLATIKQAMVFKY